MTMVSPVLFLVFNRPDTTRQVFEAIRLARPLRLYVAADGPRSTREGEVERCAEVRRIATAVDWPCEVKTLFRDTNLGCKRGVSSGIDWFFENEAEGIILEDDVLPVPGFFRYCDELLQRYREDSRVAMVGGCNLISSRYTPGTSYFFSRCFHIWGWATWRRAWKNYDVGMTQWPAWRNGGDAVAWFGDRLSLAYWREVFDSVHRGDIDTWDYQWTFACYRTGALSIFPEHNLTTNLGFGPAATHTTSGAPDYVIQSPAKDIAFPLRMALEVKRSAEADALVERWVFGITRSAALRRGVRKIPLVSRLARNVRSLLARVQI